MRKRLLVVDDDEAVRASLKQVLEQAGYEVVLAAGGLEAVGRCDLQPMDLVVLDLHLPNQNGWEVFECLTRRQPGVPIIIITGLSDQYPTALMAGAGALLEKPVEVTELLQAIEALLSEPAELHRRRLGGELHDTRYAPPARPALLTKG